MRDDLMRMSYRCFAMKSHYSWVN